MRRSSIILHDDGTITCWRTSARGLRRTPYDQVSMADVRLMRRRDLESFARACPRIRGSLSDRTHARVRMSFVLELPLGESIPSPTLEAVDAAALAVAGPVRILPGARISVGRAAPGQPCPPSAALDVPRREAARRDSKATRESMFRSLDQNNIQVSCSTMHPLSIADPVGYMSLKEAGAGLTILAYRCRACFRSLYVTEEPPVARAAGVDLSAQDDVE